MYSMPGGRGGAIDGDGDSDFGGGLEDGVAGGDVDGVTLTGTDLEAVGDAVDGVGVGATNGGDGCSVGVVWAAELADASDAADADCAATCRKTASGVVIRPWLPLTSRPTRSTAVKVTPVIKTQESSQPSASVSGRPGRRRQPPVGP
jgi:hypothetical protein